MGTKRGRLLAVLALLIALVVVTLAARSTSTRPFVPAPKAAHTAFGPPPPRAPLITAVGSGVNTEPTRKQPPGTNWGQLLYVLGLLLAAGWVVWRVATSKWSPWTSTEAPRHADLDVEAREAAPAQLRRALDESLEHLARGPVSDAIIACWVRVEEATAEAGIAIGRAETSSEFVDRVLTAYGARAEALRRMAELYREARFSSHAMDEPARAEARHHLTEIQTDLARRRAPT